MTPAFQVKIFCPFTSSTEHLSHEPPKQICGKINPEKNKMKRLLEYRNVCSLDKWRYCMSLAVEFFCSHIVSSTVHFYNPPTVYWTTVASTTFVKKKKVWVITNRARHLRLVIYFYQLYAPQNLGSGDILVCPLILYCEFYFVFCEYLWSLKTIRHISFYL